MKDDAEVPVLNEAVQRAVSGYLKAMEDEKVTDLYELVLSEIEAPLLECVLAYTRNNQSLSAQVLGLNRGTLRKKLKKYGML
ncbi:MAG: DNA-binding transcriptional regulator Fis [Pseudomonadales bacterium]|nr:DNA-binding transcriptional regulator Fis [Pseudomonadales bacterium]